jgi:hypothetical protein
VAPVTYTGGTLAGGVFTATISGTTVTLSPLTPGTQTTVSGQTPIGAVTGTAFLSPDSSFFYADLTTSNGTPQVALLAGGLPITSPSLSIGTANQVLAFNVQPDPALRSNIPFIRNATGGNLPGATISPLYLVTPTGTLAQDPAGLTTARTLQASIAINGTGANQQSVVVAHSGFISDAAPQLSGAVRATALTSSGTTPVLISSTVASVPDGVGGGLYGTTGLAGAALAASAPFATETPLTGAPTTYNFNQPAAATTTPTTVGPGLGTSPSSRFIPASGFFGGLMFTNSGTATNPYPITGSTTFTQTGPATFAASFASDPLRGGGNLASATLTFGGSATSTSNSTIIDGNIYGATEGSGATLVGSTGGVSTGTQQFYLLSSASAPPPTSLLPGGTLCTTCAFSQWGWWGGDINSTTLNRTDSGHLNAWVAGQPTVTIPRSGTGVYRGQAIGTVNTAGASYVATGTFTNTYVFDADRGNFSLTFDGRTVTGQVGPTTGGRGLYSSGCAGCLPFTGAGLTTVVNGQFFGPGTATTLPPETGGNFALTGALSLSYTAGGVFLGHR